MRLTRVAVFLKRKRLCLMFHCLKYTLIKQRSRIFMKRYLAHNLDLSNTMSDYWSSNSDVFKVLSELSDLLTYMFFDLERKIAC